MSRWLLVVAFVVLGGLLWAGGQDEEASGDVSEEGMLHVTLNSYYDTTRFPDVAATLEGFVDEYEEQNPDVSVNLIDWQWGQSESDYRTWLTARTSAGEQPTIGWEQFYTKWDQPDRWVALDDYLGQPNPYAPADAGGEQWRDVLPDFVWTNVQAPNGSYYTLPLEWVETGIFYNQDIFDDAGVSAEWETWDDFIEAQEGLADAGYEPIFINSASGWSTYQWVDDVLTTAFFSDRMDDMYMDEYREQYAQEFRGHHWRVMNTEEVAKGIYDGHYAATDERFRNMLEMLEEWSQYWISGYSTLDYDGGMSAFLSERTAMAWLGTWSMIEIERDADFNWGVTYLPPIGSDVNPNVHEDFEDVSFRVGGPSAGAQYGITTRAEEDGMVDEAVDFLMFLSTPDRFGQLIIDAGQNIPMINGVEVPSALEYFSEEIASFPERGMTDPIGRFTPEAGERYNVEIENFLGGRQDVDETMEEIQAIFEQSVADLAEENDYEWYEN